MWTPLPRLPYPLDRLVMILFADEWRIQPALPAAVAFNNATFLLSLTILGRRTRTKLRRAASHPVPVPVDDETLTRTAVPLRD